MGEKKGWKVDVNAARKRGLVYGEDWTGGKYGTEESLRGNSGSVHDWCRKGKKIPPKEGRSIGPSVTKEKKNPFHEHFLTIVVDGEKRPWSGR